MSPMRIGGLASGMDIDQIVRDLMKAERMKVDTLLQKKQITEWQQEDYRTINSSLRSFRDNNVFNMRLQSTFLAKLATSSNKDAVSASASTSAFAGTHTIEVTQLAKGASVTGDKINSDINKSTLQNQLKIVDTTTFEEKLTINGTTFEVDIETENIHALISKINSQRVTGITSNITQKAVEPNAEGDGGQPQIQKLTITDEALAHGLVIKIGDKSVGLYNADIYQSNNELAKKSLGVDAAYSIEDLNAQGGAAELVDRIATDLLPTNATVTVGTGGELVITSTEVGAQKAVTASFSGGKEFNVRASYDETLDRFFLSTIKTGNSQQITVESTDLSRALKLTTGMDMTQATGLNAQVKIDDIPEIIEYANNQFSLNGVTYNLFNTTTSKVTVTVSDDTEGVFKTITSFVDEYNKMMETIEKKLTEQRYKSYTWPLSDTEKEGLTDDQIDQWKEKARSGMLRNDETLRSIRDKMRMTVTALSKLGITTTSDYTSSKLVITEAGEKKLREAIANDLQGVMDVFQGEQGVAQKLSDQIGSTISTIIDKAGSSGNRMDDDSFLGKRIDGFNDDIDAWEKRLVQIEDRYWKQFTAMEKAISQMNQQSAWLSQQFSGG